MSDLSLQTTSTNPLYANAVLEGGGVRGIGHVGALLVAEQKGYQWVNLAGTSAGAFVAAPIATGYSAQELYSILSTELDYKRLADSPAFNPFGILDIWNLLKHGGIHPGKYMEDFMRELLASKGKRRFGDLLIKGQEHNPNPFFRYRLTVIASDISTGRMLRLPQDAHLYGLNPDELDIAWAVRMSASMPFFFIPVELTNANGVISQIVDGGLLSNFPVFLFDEAGKLPERPTFGFRLVNQQTCDTCPPAEHPAPTNNALEILEAMVSTMLTAHDRLYMDDHAYIRTISIPTSGIGAAQFDLSKQDIDMLLQNGKHAAEDFFSTWDFTAYKSGFLTKKQTESRLHRLHAEMKGQ